MEKDLFLTLSVFYIGYTLLIIALAAIMIPAYSIYSFFDKNK